MSWLGIEMRWRRLDKSQAQETQRERSTDEQRTSQGGPKKRRCWREGKANETPRAMRGGRCGREDVGRRRRRRKGAIGQRGGRGRYRRGFPKGRSSKGRMSGKINRKYRRRKGDGVKNKRNRPRGCVKMGRQQ